MNRKTRDKFAKATQQDLTSGNACWETAPLLFADLNAVYGPFDLDLTADSQRHLCATWFGPDSNVGEFDALTADWMTYGRTGYSNSPYGRFVPKILAWAKEQSQRGFSSTFLPPLRVTRAFHEHVLDGASDLIFLDKRLTFYENGVPRLNDDLWRRKGKARADCAMFDSIIFRYTPGHMGPPRVGVYKVPPHVSKADLERAAERRREQEREVGQFGRSLWEESEPA